jgi:hypothetical protein
MLLFLDRNPLSGLVYHHFMTANLIISQLFVMQPNLNRSTHKASFGELRNRSYDFTCLLFEKHIH